VGLVGDVRAVLGQLAAAPALKGTALSADPGWVSTVQVLRAAAKNTVGEGAASDGEPIHPVRLCREVREFLPREAAIVADGGDIAGFAVLTMDALSPASLQWAGAFGHLGVGLPFAIAGKLASPSRPVALITGDGSFGLSAMEFDTAVRHGIPVVCIISNDCGWGQIRRVQRNNYGRERVTGCELGVKRYDLLVESLGGFGIYVEKLADLKPAIEKAFASGLPACVNVRTDPEAVFSGMELPWSIH
jgi:acetolactate synthase I/II/III large subunit